MGCAAAGNVQAASKDKKRDCKLFPNPLCFPKGEQK